jgi:hypothetical protein
MIAAFHFRLLPVGGSSHASDILLPQINLTVFIYTSVPVFRNLFLPTAHPVLIMVRVDMPQNFNLRKGGTKQYVATINVDPICQGW